MNTAHRAGRVHRRFPLRTYCLRESSTRALGADLPAPAAFDAVTPDWRCRWCLDIEKRAGSATRAWETRRLAGEVRFLRRGVSRETAAAVQAPLAAALALLVTLWLAALPGRFPSDSDKSPVPAMAGSGLLSLLRSKLPCAAVLALLFDGIRLLPVICSWYIYSGRRKKCPSFQKRPSGRSWNCP